MLENLLGSPGLSIAWMKLLVGLSLVICMDSLVSSKALANPQDDRSMREFRALPPDDLFGILSTFYPDRELKSERDEPQLDPAQMDALEKKGREFLSSLTPDQQELAWNYAQKYLQRNGVDSDASKALMERFGVPNELQRDLSNQIRKIEDSKFQDRDEFRDAMRRATQRAMQRTRGRADTPLNRRVDGSVPGDSTDRKSGDGRDAPGDGRGKTQTQDNGTRPIPNSPGQIPPIGNERDSSTSPRDRTNRQRSNGQPDVSERSARESESSNEGRRSTDPTQGIRKKNGVPSPADTSGADSRNPDDVREFQDRLTNGSSNPDQSRASGSKGGPQRLSSDTESLPSEASKPTASPSTGEGSEFDWTGQLRELVGESTSASTGNDDRTGKNGQRAPQEVDAETRRGMLDTLKKMAAEGSTAIDKNLLQGARKTLSTAAGNARKKSTERLTARFDRLVFDSAQRIIDSKTGLGAELGAGEAVDSSFDKLINRIHKSVTASKKKSKDGGGKRNESPGGPTRQTSRSARESSSNPESPLEQVFRSQPGQGSRSGQSDGSSASSTQPAFQGVDLTGAFAGIPKVPPTYIVLFVVMVCGGMLLVYFYMSHVVANKPASKSRKYGQKFRHAKIHSPRDLVEAVDYFLVKQFGSESRWWNERHAQSVLCEGAPQYSAKISELISDYVRARYMRAEVALTETEQIRYRSTLQELSKLAGRSGLPATGTEG